jgi:hypothetical protein
MGVDPGAVAGTACLAVGAACTCDGHVRPLTPNASPGERGSAVPSPLGRRYPAGADEGTGAASCTYTPRDAFAPDPHPNLSPEGRGLRRLPSPIGSKVPEGRMRVRAQPRVPTLRETLSRRTLAPTPSPEGRGATASPFSPREKVPEGRMRVRAKPRASQTPRDAFAPDPHPNPSPEGRGASAVPFSHWDHGPFSGENARGADGATGRSLRALETTKARPKPAQASTSPPGAGSRDSARLRSICFR